MARVHIPYACDLQRFRDYFMLSEHGITHRRPGAHCAAFIGFDDFCYKELALDGSDSEWDVHTTTTGMVDYWRYQWYMHCTSMIGFSRDASGNRAMAIWCQWGDIHKYKFSIREHRRKRNDRWFTAIFITKEPKTACGMLSMWKSYPTRGPSIYDRLIYSRRLVWTDLIRIAIMLTDVIGRDNTYIVLLCLAGVLLDKSEWTDLKKLVLV